MPQTSQVAEPPVLLEGLAIGESPRWHDGRLWFSNWGTEETVSLFGSAHHIISHGHPASTEWGWVRKPRIE